MGRGSPNGADEVVHETIGQARIEGMRQITRDCDLVYQIALEHIISLLRQCR